MRIFILMALMAVLSACNPQELRYQQVETKKHMACDICHLTANPVQGPQVFREGADPSTLCFRCHAYRDNHHPVDFFPTETYYVSPGKEFPLFDGKIRCLTCHDPHGGPGLSETPKLLRGGPYADRRTPCFKCHSLEKYAEMDPHVMLDDKGGIRLINDKPVCLVCHAEMPDPETDRTTDVKFRADVAFLCWRCHPPMPGAFFKQHFLRNLSRPMAQEMKRFEAEKNVLLPMVPRDRITCSTCHNPHQKEVLVSAPAKAGAGSAYRMRIGSHDLCLACHPGK